MRNIRKAAEVMEEVRRYKYHEGDSLKDRPFSDCRIGYEIQGECLGITIHQGGCLCNQLREEHIETAQMIAEKFDLRCFVHTKEDITRIILIRHGR